MTTVSDASAALFMDRFVSATSADDARSSLELILDGLAANQIPVAALLNDLEFLESLLQLLHSGRHNKQSIPVEEGPTLVCRVLLKVASQQTPRQGPSLLTLPSPGRLIEALLDVASADSSGATLDEGISTTSAFTRVLALQLLIKLCQMHGSMAQSQLLQAPNGLHRLADLLDPSVEDQVRNEALLLAKVVSKWPSCAKIWIFAEMGDTVMKLAMAEGGLTGGGVVVLDCLELLANLVRHEASSADLAWQSPYIAPSLAKLLDLREGTNFLNPTFSSTTPAIKKVSQQQNYDDDDDLDAILNSAASTKSKEEVAVEPTVYVPRLTEKEEQVIFAVLDVLAVMLGSEAYRSRVWKLHAELCDTVWELAIVTPPPPSVAYVCAMPSAHLQQKVLETVSLYFADAATMDRVERLDRLLFLVCSGSGGSGPKEWKEKIGLSQAALHVIRQTLPKERARELVLFTLAPPMTEDLSGPPPPTVVRKLLHTIFDTLQVEALGSDKSKRINLIGGLGALTLFLVDDTSREMILRLTSTSLIDVMLESLAKLDNDEHEGAVISSILRFLCEWMIEAPPVVQAILSSTQSTVLGVLASSKTNILASTLTILLVGLAMEYMGDEEKCGGWSRQSLMEMIGKRKGGVSANATSLEQFKAYKADLPWTECGLEWQAWSTWYSSQVLVVRRRIVQELTGGAEHDDGTDDENDFNVSIESKSKVKSLQNLVSQQSQELDELRLSLSNALATIDSQQHELDTWKRRAEITPMQVDDLLNEYSSKNAELDNAIEMLKADMEANQGDFQAQLIEKDKTIAAVQSELAESKEREQETCEDRDRLREEMEGLSSAYASLEEEYQREISRASSIASAAPTGEREDGGSRTAEQPEGEVSEQMPTVGGSTEVSTLRAENTRLRSDIQAADEWMALAVARMNDFTTQIATLEGEISSLGEQLQQARSVQNSQDEETKRKLVDEQETSRQLREQLQLLVQHVHSIAGNQSSAMNVVSAMDVIDKFEILRQELIRKLDIETSELESIRKNAVQDKADHKRALDGEMQKIVVLEEVIAQQRRECDDLVASKDEELGSLLEQVDQLQRDLDERSGAVNKAQELAQTVAALEIQLKVARDDAAVIREREQAEIYKRESTIRELEAKLGDRQGRFTMEDIKARDDEIDQLRAANDAAQDWMTKAVEQHQILSEKMAGFVEENASLSRQLRDAKSQVISLKNEASKVIELERRCRELDDLTAQLTLANNTLSKRELAIEQLEVDVRRLRGQLQQLKSTEEELTRANDQITSLRNELEAFGQSRDESIYLLQNELESTKAQVSELEIEKATLLNDILLLRAADSRVAELENDIASVENMLREATESEHRVRKELETNRLELEKKSAELSAAISDGENHYHQTLILTEMVEKLEAERSKWDGLDEPIHDYKSLAVKVLELEQAAIQSQQLHSQLQEAKADLRRDEEIVHQWQERAAELEATNGELEKQLADQERDANDVISLWQESCATLEKENSRLNEEVAAGIGTKVRLAELEVKMIEQEQSASKTISQWQERCSAFEKEISRLEEEVVSGVEAVNRAKELEASLVEREKEANKIISHWQETCGALERENLLLKEELTESVRYKELTVELEAAVNDLRRQIGEKDSEIEGYVNSWREARAEMESENKSLKEGVASGIVAKERLEQLEVEIDGLNKQLLEMENEASIAISQLEEKYEAEKSYSNEKVAALTSMEAAVKDLKDQLVSQEESTESVISQLQQKCASLEAEKASLLDGATSSIDSKARMFELEESVGALEKQVGALEKQLAEQKQESYSVISQLKATCASLEAEKASLLDGATSLIHSKARIVELEESVSALNNQLVEQEQEANSVVSQWEAACASLEAEKVSLLDAVTSLMDSKARIIELEESTSALEKQLAEQQQEARIVVSQWEATCASLDAEKASLLDGATSLIDSKARNAELEESVSALEKQLLDQKQEALSVISQWEATCASLEAEKASILDGATLSTDSKARIVELEESVSALKRQLFEQEQEAYSVISQWEASCEAFRQENLQLKEDMASIQSEEKFAELEAAVRDFESRLAEQANEANEVIAQWEERCSEFENEVVELKDEIAGLQVGKADLLLTNESLRQKLEEQVQRHESTITSWESNVALLERKCEVLEHESQISRRDKETLVKGVEKVKAKMASLESICEEKDRKIADLEQQLCGMDAILAEKDALCAALEIEKGRCSSARQEVEALHSEVAQLKDIVGRLEERCILEERATSELKLAFEAERNAASQSLKAAEETITFNNEMLDSLRKQLDDKELLIASTLSELEQQRKILDEATNTHGNKDVALAAAREEIAALESENEALKAESQETVNQWKDRVEELESIVQELETQLEQASNSANEAIACWESRYEELGNSFASIEKSAQESLAMVVNLLGLELQTKDSLLNILGRQPEPRNLLLSALSSLPSAPDDTTHFISEVEEKLRSANEAVIKAVEDELVERNNLQTNYLLSLKELQTQQASLEEKIQLLEGNIQQLEATIGDNDAVIVSLKDELRAAAEKRQGLEDDCRIAIEQAETEKSNRIDAKAVCEALQAVHSRETRTFEETIEKESSRRKDLERVLEEQKRQIEKLEQEVSDYQSRADMLQIERVRIEDALNKEKILENEQIETWRQECAILKKEIEVERERWSAVVRQLEDELREANDTLQTLYTDEVSEKAAAAVAEELRKQVEEVQVRLHDNKDELAKEKAARQVAEKEVARLKLDLAALLAIDGEASTGPQDLDLVSFKASERIQRKERDEIDELRRALARSQQDLVSTRAASTDADERAAKARLQASICEQELISTKSDLKFLAQAMEEMRETDETRRASLEYRINALEDDHDVLRRFHADEVETLRNELTQVSLEKDRILHSLKESEKALSALMFASSQGSDKNGGSSSPKAELMKLKIEKEQMLSAAEEEASNVEKRIREAIGAHASSFEADIILERELRIAAEAALDNMRTEIDELRNASEKNLSVGSSSPVAVSSVDKLKTELQRSTQEIQKLAEENLSLRTELDRSSSEAKATINKLTEQCRKAQVRAHKLECDNRLEAEVKNEVTRLRLEKRDDAWPTTTEQNPADEDVDDQLPSGSKALDMIQQQKEAIQEERKLYMDLLAEHDDLLAFVAQQDLEKESLQAALLQAAGQEVVEEALKSAEQKTIAQFGKHVKLS